MKVYVVKKGDTLWKIAKMHGIPLASLIEANPHISDPDKIDVGMKVNIPTGEMHMSKYVVQSGDTLWKIAQKTGHSLASIIAANPQIANPDLIMPGQVINLPKHEMGSSHMGMGMNPKEMMTMPKQKYTEMKPVLPAPIPQPVPLAPLPSFHPEIDVTMLNYHPHYHVEIKEHPKAKHPMKPVTPPPKKMMPAYEPMPAYVPCPPPVFSPCPPGTFPAILDEFGCLHPIDPYMMYHMMPHMMPYMMPYMMHPYMSPYPGIPMMAPEAGMVPGPAVAPSTGMPDWYAPQSGDCCPKKYPSMLGMPREELPFERSEA